ncbi:MAG TPA: hypothetical protein PKA64_04770 [Myxococcota bacterium]|nr:hypothetical protein [Myxococcota bacterium]
MGSLREWFNARRWSVGDLDTLVVHARHRGAPGDERAVACSMVEKVRPGGLLVRAEDEGAEDPTWFLPWHRVLRVTGPDGVVWSRGRGA